MKKNHILTLFIIAVVILMGQTACPATVETKTVTVTGPTTTITTTIGISWLDIPSYNQFWGKINANVGEEFAIALYRNPRLGLDWYGTYDENLLVLLATGFQEYSISSGAVAGDQYFIFKALKMGTTEITFIYKHGGPEADILDEKTFTVEIQ